MSFRNRDNQLMWEHFQDSRPVQGVNQGPHKYPAPDTLYPDEFPYPQEDGEAEIMLEIEPEGPIEIDDTVGLDSPEEEMDEVLYSDIKKLAEYSNRILKEVKHSDLDTWMVAKLIKASDYVMDVWHHVDSKVDFANDQDPNISL